MPPQPRRGRQLSSAHPQDARAPKRTAATTGGVVPGGWVPHVEPQTGETYYHCDATNTTRWAHSADLAPAAAAGLPDG